MDEHGAERQRARKKANPMALWNYLWRYAQRRQYYIFAAAGLAVITGILIIFSSSLPDYGRNLSLNVAADLVGTIVVLFLIAPILDRAGLRREMVLERFDRSLYVKQVGDARRRVVILELWTDLLEGNFQKPFLQEIRYAIEADVNVQILLLDPDAEAAKQRANDLPREVNVADNIMDNLRILHEFIRDLPDRLRRNIEIRVYSALPPVQMYRVDDHMVVSFYPVNMTSWNAAQYQTRPQAQLGMFVDSKFEELWDAKNTRTLEEFRTVTVQVSGQEKESTHRVWFVSAEEQIFVSGRDIVAAHAEAGIGSLTLRLIGNSGIAHSLRQMELPSEEHAEVHRLFDRKYGYDPEDVILELVRLPPEKAPTPGRRFPLRKA